MSIAINRREALVLGSATAVLPHAARASLPSPTLTYVFTATVLVGSPLEKGMVDGKRERFVPIAGGSVSGLGHAEHLKWFVVNGMGNLRPDPQASFLRSRYLSGLENRQIEIVGLFGPACQGVLSSPGNDAHMHFRTIDDGSPFVGHVDNEIELKAGAVLYLPVSRTHEVE